MKNGRVYVDEATMDYVSFGKGKKNLVVLPGLSDGLATVKGKAVLLAGPYRRFFDTFTVYLFSRKNEMPPGYSIRAMAEDLADAMRQLGIERACVLGVSQGGMIAQELAACCPDMVEKLVLAVTAPYANPTVQAVVGSWVEMAKRGDHTALMVDTAEKMYSQAYLEKHRGAFPLLAKLTKPKSYDRFLKNAEAILRFDAREVLQEIICPTLILAGDDDKTVGNEAAEELHRGIAGSERFLYRGLGHGLFEEAADFYDRALGFCASE